MMNLSKIEEIVEIIESSYNPTTLSKHQNSRIKTILSDPDSKDNIGELKIWIGTVESRDSLLKIKDGLNGIANKVESELNDVAIAGTLRDYATYALNQSEKYPVVVKERKFLSDEKAVEYLDSLETAEQRVFCFLARYAGLTRTCMLRTDFRQIASGTLVVGERTEFNQPKGRTVTFDPSYLKDKDLEEVVPYMANKILHPGGYGLSGDQVIGQHTENLEYELRDLRNSHAASLLLKGYGWDEVAELQGVNVKALKDRMNTFLSANGIKL